MGPVLRIGQTQLDAPALLEKLTQYQMIPQLAQRLIIETAIAPVECDPEQVYRSFCQNHQLLTEADQQEWLQQQQLTLDQLLDQLVYEERLSHFKEENWGSQLESYFLQRKASLDRVLYSLIRTQDASLAQELYFRISDDGDSFAELARQYAEGQEAQTGGLIGPVELSVPHPVLAQMLSVSQPGQLWAPTPIGEWLVIARLEKFVPAQMDEATRQRLLDELFQEWLRQQLQETPMEVMTSTPDPSPMPVT
ncbi:peptidylprolyl isomerase [Romeria aff. gracilis LEGE 07310]|uniref:peptidylprolyl isomerase n=1 Tax=Vasconcelosia minhoensis LEGE 07310 TaxID=915328 RepID=A0A8J7DLP4_9CYAN|nr:peptidylprolyl isomerase [Romeria gracilis]MBE9077391.1 peptidylprolyl isomerase [Romeria aff. gracilis LEGE 07310]